MEFLTSDKILVAIISLISAVIGGTLTSIVSPLIKANLDEKQKEKDRKRAQIKEWRDMLLEVQLKAENGSEVGQLVQLHPAYLTLEPYLDDEVRKSLHRDNRIMVIETSLSKPLEDLKKEISRIELKWKLR